MAALDAHDGISIIVFGILGNIVSLLVFLAPVPTFWKIYKRKSTEGFHSLPYSVALFSSMLYLYYAVIHTAVIWITIINSVGFFIESIYLGIYLYYAPRIAKIYTAKLVLLLNIVVYGLIMILTLRLSSGSRRLYIVGWICAVFSVIVFASPLSIMMRVIRTKSVEYMPFWLSFFLTISAVLWFFYGFLLQDFFIATPNILGFTFGVVQMILYAIYKFRKHAVVPEPKEDGIIIEIQENLKSDEALKKTQEEENKESMLNSSQDKNESNV